MAIKDKKHWSTKSEAAHDEVKDAVESAIEWLIVRRREATWAAAGIAVAALALGLFIHGRNSRINAAWDKLSQAELYAYSGRGAEAQALLNQIADEASSRPAATLATMLQGDLHYARAEYDQALTSYDKAAQTAPEGLRAYAAAEKVATLEAAGKAAECAAAAQSFLDSTPDHLLAAQVHACLARCQLAQGQADAAKATLQRISLQYPNTPWSAWAGSRLQTPSVSK